jgi:type III restriction enzyme
MRDGTVSERTRDLLEDMRMRCGSYLQQQIRTRSRDCLNSIRSGVFSNNKLDKTACLHSKALNFYGELAEKVVREYESNVQLTLFADERDGTYVVGPYQPSGATEKVFDRAGHTHYDTKAFNPDELEVAKALDRWPHVWVRNKSRLDYGIPLPVKSSGSSTFYPDFLWWVRGTVWALDPTGQFILEEKVRAKLLNVPDPLRIALLTRGKLDPQFRKFSNDGWSLLRRRMGNTQPETFDSIREVLMILVGDSDTKAKRSARANIRSQRVKRRPNIGAKTGKRMPRRRGISRQRGK